MTAGSRLASARSWDARCALLHVLTGLMEQEEKVQEEEVLEHEP